MSFPVGKSNVSKVRKSRGGKVKSFRPQMTSLVDIMTILLVFLVKSFSAEGNVMNVPNDVQLPTSTAKEAPKPAVILSINNNVMVVDGNYIARVGEVMKKKDLLIDPLYKWLMRRKETTERIAEFSTKTEFKGDITIQGDKEISFALVQKIMFTCGRVGFNNFSLAVIQEE